MSYRCDRDKIRQLLSESLPAAVERDVAEHVAICPDCRSDLESLAAEGSWWNEAYSRLNRGLSDEFSRESIRSTSDEDVQFVTDFAVDFLEPSDDPKMLGRLAEYEIVEVIGRGGMGIVVKGFQKELHRHVAVKILSPHLATSGPARRRFAREAQATAAVVHPHVMAIHSVQANAKLPYLVMPYVGCESLQQRLDKHGPLELKDILRIGMQTALGLAAAHSQGLVHRDVKPANILLESNVDRVVLTDFGLARAVDDASLTRTGIIAGTPQYMSPEQANGDGVDPRSDLFSLGGVLYAMSTGRPPFRAETTFGILRRIRETSPRSIREINAEIPAWFERIVLKLLEKQANDRFPTAQQVATLLEQCLAHVQNPTVVNLSPLAMEISLKDDGRNRGVDSPKTAPRLMTRISWIALLALGSIGLVKLCLLLLFVEPQQRIAFVDPQTETMNLDGPSGTAPHQSLNQTFDQGERPLFQWNGLTEDLEDVVRFVDQLETEINSVWGQAQ